MIFRQITVLIHVERNDVLEAQLTSLVMPYQALVPMKQSGNADLIHSTTGVRRNGTTARWQSQHERAVGGRLELVDAMHDIVGHVVANGLLVGANDEPHAGRRNLAINCPRTPADRIRSSQKRQCRAALKLQTPTGRSVRGTHMECSKELFPVTFQAPQLKLTLLVDERKCWACVVSRVASDSLLRLPRND